MLGKVMKYELRSGARTLLPFFGLAVVGSALMRLVLLVAPYIWEPIGNLLSGIAGSIGGILMVAVIIVTIIIVIMRFYQSTVKSEAYLTFTLPVKAGTHIIARLLVSSLWLLCSIVVTVICGIVFIPGFGSGLLNLPNIVMGQMNGQTITLGQLGGGTQFSLIMLVVFFILLAIVTNLIKIYASVAVGSVITRSRLAGSIIAYIVINLIETMLILPMMAAPAIQMIGSNSREVMAYFEGLVVRGDVAATFGNMLGTVWLFAAIIGAISLVFSVLFFFLSRYFFTKKINLE